MKVYIWGSFVKNVYDDDPHFSAAYGIDEQARRVSAMADYQRHIEKGYSGWMSPPVKLAVEVPPSILATIPQDIEIPANLEQVDDPGSNDGR